jgi:exosortase/archaeosortase family protein
MVFTNSKLQNKAGEASSSLSRVGQLRRHLSNRRSLYLCLAALVFCWNSSILWFTQSLELQTFNLLLWLGILIALEDQLSNLWPKPSQASFFAGALILALLLSLSPWMINEQDGYVKYLLLPVIVVSMALLSRPLGNLQLFKNPLLIAMLLPLSGSIEVVTSPILNRLTALLTWTLLYGLGFQATLSGKEVSLPSGGVQVETPCNGVEQLIFSVSIIIIFQLIFPLQKGFNIHKALIGATLSAIALNVLRIAFLAYLTTWPNRSGMPAFDFFHGHGGLLFSLVASAVACWLYVTLLHSEHVA